MKWTAKKISFVIVFVGALILGGLFLLKPTPNKTPIVKNIPFVKTIEIEPSSGSIFVNGHGVVKAEKNVNLSMQVSGKVIYINPSLVTGGLFKEGDILLEVDKRPYQARLEQVVAERKALEAKLAFFEKEYKRYSSLSRTGTASRSRFEEVSSNRNEIQAQLLNNQAKETEAQLNIEYSTLKAPFDGQVLQENVDIGDYLVEGKEVAQIFSTDMAEIVVPLSHGKASLIPGLLNLERANNQKSIKAHVVTQYGLSKYQWNGYVDRMEAGVDTQTRTIDVVVKVEQPLEKGQAINNSEYIQIQEAPSLLMGSYAEVKIEGKNIDQLFKLPIESIRDRKEVWAVDDNKLKIIPIQIIEETEKSVFVYSQELKAGDQLVVSYLPFATHNMQVKIRQ